MGSRKVYIVEERFTSRLHACGSVLAVSRLTGLGYDRLLYQFSRIGRSEYSTDLWRVCLVGFITSGRKVVLDKKTGRGTIKG